MESVTFSSSSVAYDVACQTLGQIVGSGWLLTHSLRTGSQMLRLPDGAHYTTLPPLVHGRSPYSAHKRCLTNMHGDVGASRYHASVHGKMRSHSELWCLGEVPLFHAPPGLPICGMHLTMGFIRSRTRRDSCGKARRQKNRQAMNGFYSRKTRTLLDRQAQEISQTGETPAWPTRRPADSLV